jgi:ABC-2 type transport system permease protein
MATQIRDIRAIARLDFAEVTRSRWLVFAFVVYAVLAAAFVLVGLRESTVLQFTGMSRVMLNLCHVLVLLLPMLALTATGQVVGQARDEGTLELLFAQPISRTGYFVGVTFTRYAMLVVPLALLLLGLAAYGRFAFHQPIDWGFLGWALVLSAALVWCFVGVGLWVSAMARSQAKALIALLLIWAAAVALLDFALVGMMLQMRLNHQTVLVLGALNPVQASRVALLMAADPELSWLGPVGFWLSTRVGGATVLAAGVAWPALVGTVAWLLALRRFCRGDVV